MAKPNNNPTGINQYTKGGKAGAKARAVAHPKGGTRLMTGSTAYERKVLARGIKAGRGGNGSKLAAGLGIDGNRYSGMLFNQGVKIGKNSKVKPRKSK